MNNSDLFLNIIKLGFHAASIDKQTVQEEVDVIKKWSLTYFNNIDSGNLNFNSAYNPFNRSNSNNISKKKISDQLKYIYKDVKENTESYHDILYEIASSNAFQDNIFINNIPLRYDILQFIVSIIQADNKITIEEAKFLFDLKKSLHIDHSHYTHIINKLILSLPTIECFIDTIDKIYGLNCYNNKKKTSSILINQYKFWNNMTTSQNKFYRDRGEKIILSLAQLKLKYDV